MSADRRVLSLRVATLRLSEHDDLERLFPRTFGFIEIWADTLQVEGWIRLHERALHIRARCIEARPAGDRPAVLDVSGFPAQPDFDPRQASSGPDGSPDKPDGRDGRAGGDGHDGGEVVIVVDCVQGSLGIAANGSRGGHSERGGNGARPAAVDGADADFRQANWPARGDYGGAVLQKQGLQTYVAWAAGQPGGDARPGGNAGAAGRPGQGGNGGHILLSYSGPDKPTLATIAVGGDAGLPGEPAAPGAAGLPGRGGRNKLYAYNALKGGSHWAFAREGKDRFIDAFARQYKIDARAANGKALAGAGTVPAPPSASPGRAGQVQVEPVAIDAVGAEFDTAFLQLVLAHAERDRVQGEHERARERSRWLARVVTEARAQSDAADAEIRNGALAAVAAPGAFGAGRAPSRQRRSRAGSRQK